MNKTIAMLIVYLLVFGLLFFVYLEFQKWNQGIEEINKKLDELGCEAICKPIILTNIPFNMSTGNLT